VLTVPATAIVEEKGQARCVIVADGQAARRPIGVGLMGAFPGPGPRRRASPGRRAMPSGPGAGAP
jgi:hypothetical protein